MAVHPFDFQIAPRIYSTPEYLALFDEKTNLQRWLDFEAALAGAQGKLGIIPAEAAAEISARAHLKELDLEMVRKGYEKSRNSVVPLLAGLRRACTNGHGEYVHYGATTQDVLDTGEILALRDTFRLLYRDLRELEDVCLGLAETHCRTPMAARSHGQQALPTTFGLKTVVWATEVRRHLRRIMRLYSTVRTGQLSGAVGTYAALGDKGLETARETMRTLGLKHDVLSWHTSRDDIAETASVFTMIGVSMAKTANEIFQLQKTEFGELAEPSPSGTLASSTMPHKQNPVTCQRIIALSKHIRALNSTIMEGMAHEHERDPRSLWAEWLAIPQLCIYTGTCVHLMLNVLTDLTVRPERMLENLYRQKQLITTEWLLFELGKTMGKSRALDKLHQLTEQALASGADLKQLIKNDRETGPRFTENDLAPLDHPEQYTGQAERIVTETVKIIRAERINDPEELTVSDQL